ncbi:MAG: polysaccharide biosynthesis C-terminal domain-containing protein [Terracidiphilus sp.]
MKDATHLSPIGPAATPPARSALHSAAWNYAGYACQLAINFGLTFFIVRILSQPEYGLLVLIISLSANMYLLDLGISSVLVPQYVAASIEGGIVLLNELASATFILLAALGAVGALLMAALAFVLPGPFKIPPQLVHDGVLTFLCAAITVQLALPTMAIEQVYQSAHRFDRLNQIRVISAVVQLILTAAALMAGYRVIGLAAIQSILAALQMLLLFIALPSSVPGARLRFGRIRWQLLSGLSRQGRWAFLHNLSASLFDVAAWFLLGALTSMRETALYGLALKLPRQTWNLVDKGTTVLLPGRSRSSAKGDLGHLRNIFFMEQTLLIGGVFPIALLGSVFAAPILTLWAGSTYVDAAPVMRWLLLWIFAQCIAYPSDELLYACGQVRNSSLFSLITSATALIAALFLTPRYGAAGLAASIALAQLLAACPLFLSAGLRISGASPLRLLEAALPGMLFPAAVLLLAIALVFFFAKHLSPALLLLAATACGLLYFALWSRSVVLPLYRSRVENRAEVEP